eukprot:9478631-Pyramimonas_sp.AAC.1
MKQLGTHHDTHDEEIELLAGLLAEETTHLENESVLQEIPHKRQATERARIDMRKRSSLGASTSYGKEGQSTSSQAEQQAECGDEEELSTLLDQYTEGYEDLEASPHTSRAQAEACLKAFLKAHDTDIVPELQQLPPPASQWETRGERFEEHWRGARPNLMREAVRNHELPSQGCLCTNCGEHEAVVKCLDCPGSDSHGYEYHYGGELLCRYCDEKKHFLAHFHRRQDWREGFLNPLPPNTLVDCNGERTTLLSDGSPKDSRRMVARHGLSFGLCLVVSSRDLLLEARVYGM